MKSLNLVNLLFADLGLIKKGKPTHITTMVTVLGDHGARTYPALIDTGATSNFITQLRVKELGLYPTAPAPKGVKTLAGQSLRTYGMHSLVLRSDTPRRNFRLFSCSV